MYNNLNISDEDRLSLKKAISWITLLIAGADGNIEKEELDWANKIAEIRSYSSSEKLTEYYKSVGEDFSSVLDAELDALPGNTEERTRILADKISGLNTILASMNNNDAALFYSSFISFAEHVAKATGGFLRFFSVSGEEKKLMGLPMLQAYEYSEEEE